MKKEVLRLTQGERSELERLVASGNVPGWKIRRAQCLLACDESDLGRKWTDKQVARAYGCTSVSAATWRAKAVREGVASALARKAHPQPAYRRIIRGEEEAQLVVLACSPAPDGRACWTLQLLAGGLVRLNVVEKVSKETVRRALKKTNCNLGATSVGA